MKKPFYKSILRIFEYISSHIIVAILLVQVIVFSLLSPSFLNLSNLFTMLTQNSSLIIIAVGLSFIMLGGGIDLSLGFQVSLASVLLGFLMAHGVSSWLSILAAVLVGLMCGALNGIIIILLRIPPFAATLATQLIFKSLANVVSHGRAYTKIPDVSASFIGYPVFNIPLYFWIAIICLLVYGLLFAFTYFGAYIRAIGENEQAVRRIGIKVNWVKLIFYMLGSFFFSIQAVILTFRNGIASPSTGEGLEIIAITAVFLGCDSSIRNESSGVLSPMFHLVIGVLILVILEYGMLLVGWNQNIQNFVKGCLLIFAITFYYRGKVTGLFNN